MSLPPAHPLRGMMTLGASRRESEGVAEAAEAPKWTLRRFSAFRNHSLSYTHPHVEHTICGHKLNLSEKYFPKKYLRVFSWGRFDHHTKWWGKSVAMRHLGEMTTFSPPGLQGSVRVKGPPPGPSC